MSEGAETFLVLQNDEGKYFREWRRDAKQVHFVAHVSVARVFRDRVLAESFQRFLGKVVGVRVEICDANAKGGKAKVMGAAAGASSSGSIVSY